jgi:TRAP-type C4-dicarboxylate transport system substrate-binding protein
LNVHYGEALAPAREALDGLSIAAYEMALVGAGFMPGKIPVIEGTGLPFLPTPTHYHTTAVREALFYHPSGRADLARWNTIPIMQVPLGSNEFMGKGTPPRMLADWKGKRVRALSGDAKAMQLLGAAPANLPAPEVYGAVERGLLDAMSSQLQAFDSFRMQEICNWYTTNMSLSSPAFVLGASKKAFDALPPQYRQLLTDLSPGVMRAWLELYREADDKAVELYKARGMTAILFPESELQTLRGSIKPVWDEWVASVNRQGYNGQDLIDVMVKAAERTKAPS